jgi:pimeloyl-ACP methyl ester carboxylesterase
MPEDNNVVVQWPELFGAVKGLQQGARNKVTVQREYIPIIFVPGIMGTRMKNSSNEKVWDPDDGGFMFIKYGMVWRGAEDKKAAIIGTEFSEDFLQPYLDDKKHNQKFLADFAGAEARGWGALSWSSYGAILTALQQRTWPASVGVCFDMPVHAFGYNWTASNSSSGKKLKQYIDEVIQRYTPCEKVILVTHSMGGLVARSACMEHGASAKVLGVMHGVQPATGSAAAYWRMKAGFERPQKVRSIEALKAYATTWVLGTNGEEVTALLGNMPGGLQLLPSQDYTTNGRSKQWLQFQDHEGTQVDAKPQCGDPYEEIYKNDKDYWRLVNPAHLMPEQDEDGPISVKLAWSGFKRRVDMAKAFHTKVKLQPDYEATSFHGSGPENPTADRAVYKVSPTGWIKKAGEYSRVAVKVLHASRRGYLAAGVVLGFEIFKRTDTWKLRGGFQTELILEDTKLVVELMPPDGEGDGTVPESSGKGMEVDSRAFPGIAHEPAYQYKDEGKGQGVQQFTFAAIEKFCRDKIAKRIGKK